MSTFEEQWISLTETKRKVNSDEVAKVFSSLRPVSAEFMTKGSGNWKGADLDTGHPTRQTMIDLNWAGKQFRSTEDVDPIVVYDKDGKRKWNSDWGHARLREMKFGGGNTIAMLYDDFPIVDYFHYVTDDLVAGAMDSKKMAAFGTYYFYLSRLS